MLFRVGDLVKVIKKLEPNWFAGRWMPAMDRFVGDGNIYDILNARELLSNEAEVVVGTVYGQFWFPEECCVLAVPTNIILPATNGSNSTVTTVADMLKTVTGKPMSNPEKCIIAKIALYLKSGDIDKVKPDEMAVLVRVYDEHRR